MIEIEAKVVGLIGEDFLTIAEKVILPDGARVKDAYIKLYKTGVLDKKVYKKIKKPRPPLFVVINDEMVTKKPMATPLQNGDSVSIMQMITGG